MRGPFGRIEDKHGIDEPAYTPPADDPDLQPESSPERPDRWHERLSWRLLIILALVFVFAGWRAGTFDHLLFNVGLNAKPCARNGFGAVFCGKELEERQAQQETAQREGKEAGEKLEREGREAEAKAQEEEHSSQEAIERSEGQSESG